MEDQADVGVASFYVTPSRSKVTKFSPGISEGLSRSASLHTLITISRFFIKFPGQETNWFTFLQPFSSTLWFFLVLLLLSVAGLLTAAYYYGYEHIIHSDSFLPDNSLLITWGSWMAQGSWIDPKSISSRIIFLTSFLFGVILYTAFSAKLISFLSVAKVTLPFSSLEELLASQEYRVGVVRGTSDYSLFFTAQPGTVHHSVAHQLISNAELVDSMQEGAERIRRDSKYAFAWDTISMPNEGGCEFLEIPFDVDSNIIAMAWNPRLPHRALLDHFLGKMKESGQLSRILRTWLPESKADCWGSGQFKSMGLENTVSAFALVAMAVIIAFIIFLGELVITAHKKKQKLHIKDTSQNVSTR